MSSSGWGQGHKRLRCEHQSQTTWPFIPALARLPSLTLSSPSFFVCSYRARHIWLCEIHEMIHKKHYVDNTKNNKTPFISEMRFSTQTCLSENGNMIFFLNNSFYENFHEKSFRTHHMLPHIRKQSIRKKHLWNNMGLWPGFTT